MHRHTLIASHYSFFHSSFFLSLFLCRCMYLCLFVFHLLSRQWPAHKIHAIKTIFSMYIQISTEREKKRWNDNRKAVHEHTCTERWKTKKTIMCNENGNQKILGNVESNEKRMYKKWRWAGVRLCMCCYCCCCCCFCLRCYSLAVHKVNKYCFLFTVSLWILVGSQSTTKMLFQLMLRMLCGWLALFINQKSLQRYRKCIACHGNKYEYRFQWIDTNRKLEILSSSVPFVLRLRAACQTHNSNFRDLISTIIWQKT